MTENIYSFLQHLKYLNPSTYGINIFIKPKNTYYSPGQSIILHVRGLHGSRVEVVCYVSFVVSKGVYTGSFLVLGFYQTIVLYKSNQEISMLRFQEMFNKS